jgi:Helix-turn-helix of insertion element transposase
MLAQNGTACSTKQAQAALLLAEDGQPDEAIATAVGIGRSTLARWKRQPAFAALVAEHREAFKDRALTNGFADKRARIALLDSTAQDIARWLAENDYERDEVKLANNGEAVTYKIFDKARYDSLRGALDDIAKELGDRVAKTELTGKDGSPLVFLVGVQTERL